MSKRISQETFVEVVKENLEEFDMEVAEAVQDAIEQFEAQGVDLSNLVTDVATFAAAGDGKIDEVKHPMDVALEKLQVAVTDGQPPRVEDPVAATAALLELRAVFLDEVGGAANKNMANAKGAMPLIFRAMVAAGGVSAPRTEPGATGLREVSVASYMCLRAAIWKCPQNRIEVPPEVVDWLAEEVECGLAAVRAGAGAAAADDARVQAAKLDADCDTAGHSYLTRESRAALFALVPVLVGKEAYKRRLQQDRKFDRTVRSVLETCCCSREADDHWEAALAPDRSTDAKGLAACLPAKPAAVACDCLALLRGVVTGDDKDAPVSKTFDYAREWATDKLTVPLILRVGRALEHRASVARESLAALRAIAVNDEICKHFYMARNVVDDFVIPVLAEHLEEVQRSQEEGGEEVEAVGGAGGDRTPMPAKGAGLGLIRVAISLVRALANSDEVKVRLCRPKDSDEDGRGGTAGTEPIKVVLAILVAAMKDASITEQCLAVIASVTLRQPANSRLLLELGVARLFRAAMQTHAAHKMVQWQSCHALRNLVSRTPEARLALEDDGVVDLIRTARANHDKKVADVAYAALRDMGIE